MPKGGYFFDCIVRQEPIDEEKLNPEDNLEEFGPISQADLDHLARMVHGSDRDGARCNCQLWWNRVWRHRAGPGPFLKHPKGIRDVAEWYVSTRSRQDYIHKSL